MKASVTLLIPTVLVLRFARPSYFVLRTSYFVLRTSYFVLRTSYFVLRSLCFFLARDAYTEPIQTRSGLIEARYLCRPSCAARIESRAEIGELGGSDCFTRPTHARNPDAEPVLPPVDWNWDIVMPPHFAPRSGRAVLVHRGSTSTTTTHHHHDLHRHPRPTSRSSTRSCCCS